MPPAWAMAIAIRDFGHRVHRRGQKRDVQRHRGGQARPGVGGRRQDLRRAGNEKHIVEGEGFAQFHGRVPEVW